MFGYRRGYRFWWRKPPAVPAGYTYIGPCRCGFGPHAYYQEPSGRIIHAWHFYHWGIPPEPTEEDRKAELEELKEEKEALERRIAELEKRTREEREIT